MYAIVKTGGKQYRVEEGQTLLVERLPGDAGAKLDLEPLLFAGTTPCSATSWARSRWPPRWSSTCVAPSCASTSSAQRGYRRKMGHRQELTRIRVTKISKGS